MSTKPSKHKVFNSAIKYLTAKEQDAVDYFIDNEPFQDGWYKKGKEVYRFTDFQLPAGAKTRLTHSGPIQKDGFYSYTTPMANRNMGKVVTCAAIQPSKGRKTGIYEEWNADKVLKFIEEAEFMEAPPTKMSKRAEALAVGIRNKELATAADKAELDALKTKEAEATAKATEVKLKDAEAKIAKAKGN